MSMPIQSMSRSTVAMIDGALGLTVGAASATGLELLANYAHDHDFSKRPDPGANGPALAARVAGGAALLVGLGTTFAGQFSGAGATGLGLGVLGASLLVTPSILRAIAD